MCRTHVDEETHAFTTDECLSMDANLTVYKGKTQMLFEVNLRRHGTLYRAPSS
ncbi:hypothetical protein A2U01_0058726 [Trifolium medium]|uniref:Uncharacterized protein n=1 Tax=Trifolium medium TaxID=97028 RepID=A0A392RMR9_9FABA|nr:hypothetical protein [Trifolium medium]